VFTTNGTYPWSFVTQIFHNGQLSHGGDRKSDDLCKLVCDWSFELITYDTTLYHL